MKRKISISLPEEIVKEIEGKAKSKGINRSAYISMSVMEYMKAEEMWEMLKKNKK